jgi:L-cysteine desulfidase
LVSEEELLSIIERETVWAIGCTEPAMVALAVSRATDLAGGKPEDILVQVSGGVMKNGRSVGLPGTHKRGLDMASALGASGLDWKMGLSLFSDVTEDNVRYARSLLESGTVRVCCDLGGHGVYVRAVVKGPEHTGLATIKGNHVSFVEIMRDGAVIEDPEAHSAEYGGNYEEGPEVFRLKEMRFSDFLDLVMSLSVEHPLVARLEEGSSKAMELATAVVEGKCLEGKPPVSKGIQHMFVDKVLMKNDLAAEIRLKVASAVSARMNGAPWPVLTSAGSGNQGLLIGISVGNACDFKDVSTEERRRALLIAHTVNMYLKAFTGEISPLCGAITAGAGVAASVCWLLGGNAESIGAAIENVLGGFYGVICDGAKASCALKISGAASEGIVCGCLAYQGIAFGPADGIVSGCVDETIGRAGILVNKGLSSMDELILDTVSLGSTPC